MQGSILGWVNHQRKPIDGRDPHAAMKKTPASSPWKEAPKAKRLKRMEPVPPMADDDSATDLEDAVRALPSTPPMAMFETLLEPRKMIKDSVHGCIYLEPLCMAIIDTMQFQRLRHLKQLGASSHVYMSATHSRFEHSIGVAFLAEKMLRRLCDVQPWLPISPTDVLCVKIAGLCHDLGHGPFSHVYDGIFMEQLRERGEMLPSMDGWTHEQGSLDLLDHLLYSNRIDLSEHGLTDIDYVFIRELILGRPLSGDTYQGRPDAMFLYQVVNNSVTGLDVDKLDYFMRDALYTGAKSSCDTHLLLSAVRVLPDRTTGDLSMCWPEKLAEQLLKVFRTRFELHQAVYQHKVSRAVEYMICDALLEADALFKMKGTRISRAPLDMDAYQLLDDRILSHIECSTDPRLAKSQAILRRISEKPLYKCIGKTQITTHSQTKSIPELKHEIAAMVSPPLDVAQLILERNKVHYGQKEKDPLCNMRFFKKAATGGATCYQLAPALYEMHCPKHFLECNLRLFVRDASLAPTSRVALAKWSEERNHSSLHPQES
ncbi:hypothetical protein SDRG_13521 [Saprolegnia diclina VS20]|uniref:HD/PDEase domain-containing protein n=1 Tax=Saprolegnia diclina (strain VS20) TaxID=1156394 RepID=T0PT08_SAPDV|nr:hypothetical protein SDRG_13521 [Saprolegnia diclina VS20]EQC28644.1 hypothetical protein SDRG_13521 [Saprolegnia diclina VS20]|eukprot:XP_008617836.1 hypothetical protein SDRG_13521 [Saprolegnia diclina VS20]